MDNLLLRLFSAWLLPPQLAWTVPTIAPPSKHFKRNMFPWSASLAVVLSGGQIDLANKIKFTGILYSRKRKRKWEGKAARLQRSLRGRRTRYVCVGGRVYLSTADTAGMQCLQCQQWVLEFTPSPRQKKKTPQRGGREGSDKHINKITKPLRVFVRFSRLFCVVNFIACTEVQKWARLLDARFFLHPQPTLRFFLFYFFYEKWQKRRPGGGRKKWLSVLNSCTLILPPKRTLCKIYRTHC